MTEVCNVVLKCITGGREGVNVFLLVRSPATIFKMVMNRHRVI
jgi:hypothetical protein